MKKTGIAPSLGGLWAEQEGWAPALSPAFKSAETHKAWTAKHICKGSLGPLWFVVEFPSFLSPGICGHLCRAAWTGTPCGPSPSYPGNGPGRETALTCRGLPGIWFSDCGRILTVLLSPTSEPLLLRTGVQDWGHLPASPWPGLLCPSSPGPAQVTVVYFAAGGKSGWRSCVETGVHILVSPPPGAQSCRP